MTDGRFAPRPWFGCDTYGEAWKVYCEAWGAIEKDKRQTVPLWRYESMVGRKRGKDGLATFKHNVELVEQDLVGELPDRNALPKLLKY